MTEMGKKVDHQLWRKVCAKRLQRLRTEVFPRYIPCTIQEAERILRQHGIAIPDAEKNLKPTGA